MLFDPAAPLVCQGGISFPCVTSKTPEEFTSADWTLEVLLNQHLPRISHRFSPQRTQNSSSWLPVAVAHRKTQILITHSAALRCPFFSSIFLFSNQQRPPSQIPTEHFVPVVQASPALLLDPKSVLLFLLITVSSFGIPSSAF